MKRTLFGLFVAAAMVSSQAVAADADKDKTTSTRSAGAYPVVYDDYPESDLVIDVGQDVVLTITGEARTRFEWVENTTDFSSNGFAGAGDDSAFDDTFSYAPARFNLGFRIDLPRDAAAVVELQSNFELGGGVGGAGTELRAQTTQHLRPGVLNPGPSGLGLGHVGHANDSLGDPAEPRHLEIVRTLNDVSGDGNVYVYQGYIETAHVGDSIFSMRFGRQELAYGTEWLLGNQDWYDGQTFDGIKGIFEFTDKHRLDLFWVKLAERDTTLDAGVTPAASQGGNDSDLYGAYFTAQTLGGSSVGMDAYVIGLSDGANLQWNVEAHKDAVGYTAIDNGFALANGFSYLSSWWAGVRFFREREHGFTFSAELTYQWGNVEAAVDNDGDGVADHNSLNIGAWGLESFLAYTWDTPTNPSLKGGVTFASGSAVGDYARGDSKTFFTPAGEVHPRLGLMDLVDASNVLAFNLGYAGSANRHSWGVDLWHFEYDNVDPFVEDATVADAALAAGHDLSNELGQEVDLWYNYQYSEHMVAQFAISYFAAGGFIQDMGDCADEGGACDPSTDGGEPTDLGVNDAWRVYANLLVRF